MNPSSGLNFSGLSRCCLMLYFPSAFQLHGKSSSHQFGRFLHKFLDLSLKKSNEDMILALAGQFKQLSHEPEKFR